MVARLDETKDNKTTMDKMNNCSLSMGILVLLFLSCMPPVSAQSHRPSQRHAFSGNPDQLPDSASRARMHGMSLAFITEELKLDEKEAERFRFIFDGTAEGQAETEVEQRKLRMELKDASKKSVSEFNAALEALLAVELEQTRQRADLLRELADEFGPDLAMKCLEARRKFKRVVLERMEARMSKKHRYPAGEMGQGPESD